MWGRRNTIHTTIPNCDELNALFVKGFIEAIEDFPDDLGRLISAFKDRDAECVQILERIDQLTGRATEDTESNNVFRKVEKLAKDLDDATKEKLRLVMAMKEMIELKFDTVNKAFKSTEMNSSSERRDDTPTSDAHNELSTPSSSEVQKSTVKSKRGRKAKQALFADEDDEDYSSPADESSMMSNLSLLAQVALSNASPVPVKVARKTSKIPVVQHAGSSKPESSKPGSSVFEEMSDASDMDDEDESVNEPLYCLCHSISHGRMVKCDYEKCKLEWFHFDCVGIKRAPKGKWYCPQCRSKKSNMLKIELATGSKVANRRFTTY